jgi:phosphatidate cytidylyltransferase
LKSNFLKRAITSAVFVAVLIGGSLLHPASFFVLFSIIVILGITEFNKVIANPTHRPQNLAGIILGLTVFLSFFFNAMSTFGNEIFLINILAVTLILIFELYRKKEDPIVNIALTIFSALYIAVPIGLLSYFVFLRNFGGEYNPVILISYFALIWINDTGAYMIGSQFGKHRLFERISPKKSWEGFLGGALFSLLGAYLIFRIIGQFELIHWFAISIITFTFGTMGDLLESLIKRSVNKKDSGSLLPGHGGILDRFDSLLLSSPIVFVYIMIFIKN